MPDSNVSTWFHGIPVLLTCPMSHGGGEQKAGKGVVLGAERGCCVPPNPYLCALCFGSFSRSLPGPLPHSCLCGRQSHPEHPRESPGTEDSQKQAARLEKGIGVEQGSAFGCYVEKMLLTQSLKKKKKSFSEVVTGRTECRMLASCILGRAWLLGNAH